MGKNIFGFALFLKGKTFFQCVFFYSCPVDDKLISRFRGSWSETGVYETQVFAYMKTFRFTGSPALYIECDVRMCHGRCPVRNVKTPLSNPLSSVYYTYYIVYISGAI